MLDKVLNKRRKRKTDNSSSILLRFVDNLDESSRKIFLPYLKGNAIVSYYRWHDCIILLFDFKYFEDNYRRLFSEKFFVDNKYVLIMGTCFSKKSKIKIVDNIKKGSQHKYLRLNGEIVLSIDKICNVLLFDINIDGWYPNSVRLWPKIKDAQQCFQSWLERTPPSTSSVSSNFSFSSKDTVH